MKRKLENETRDNFNYVNRYKKVNHGEIYNNETIQDEKSINLRWLRGQSTADSQDVMDSILENIKVYIGTDAYTEVLSGEPSKYALSTVITDAEVQLAAPDGIGPRPERNNYVEEDRYSAAVKTYDLSEQSLRIKWLKDKSYYERDIVKVKAVVLKDHTSPELLKATKRSQKKEFTAIESAKTLTSFFTLLRKAISIEVDDNSIDLVTTIKMEISSAKIADYGDATDYMSKQVELVENWKIAEVELRVERISDRLTANEKKLRTEEIEKDVDYETDGDSTVGDKIYKEVLNYGMPTNKKDQYLDRDGLLEIKKGNQYSRRKNERGKSVGGMNTMFEAFKKTLSSLKSQYTTQKLYFSNTKFVKSLSTSATSVDDGKPAGDHSKYKEKTKECNFCKETLKKPVVALKHTWYDCHWNSKCSNYKGDAAKKAKIEAVGKPKPPKPPGSGRPPSNPPPAT